MTYETLIRHTRPVEAGEGAEHWLEYRYVQAESEEDAFRRTRRGPDEFIACIDARHHQGIDPYSVETGDPAFFTDAHRPPLDLPAGQGDRVG